MEKRGVRRTAQIDEMLSSPSNSAMETSPCCLTSSIPCTLCLRRLRCSRQWRALWMALMALTGFCLAFQYVDVLLDVPEPRNDEGSEGLMTLRVNESLATLQSHASESTPGQDRPARERSPRESFHTGVEHQVCHGEDKPKESGLLLSLGPDRVCQPKNHIVFLKTHKTASSTIVNILYRYGDALNLSFGLPVHKNHQFFYPHRFDSSYVEGVRSKTVKEYHIICNHLRFNKPELEELMPEDTFYFSIMRHPVTMFESAFTYYKSIQAFHNSTSLEDFLDRCWWNYNPSVANNQHAHNNLAFDFGFDSNVSYNSTGLEERARAAVAAIQRDFHLVLISEYFDESMVLLKRALCWSLDHVVSFRLNSRSQLSRRMPPPHIAHKVTAWNALDWRLYVHFNATFWRRVDEEVGREEMAREVGRLRRRRDRLQTACLQDGGPVNPEHVKDAGVKPFQYGKAVIQGYNLKPALGGQTKMKCQKLITPELQYSDYLYRKQFAD